MVSIGEIEKIRQDIQKKIDSLKNLNESYKKSIDDCDPAGISSHAYFISRTEDELDRYKDHWTLLQGDEIDNLKREYAVQFRRLNLNKVCECRQKRIDHDRRSY